MQSLGVRTGKYFSAAEETAMKLRREHTDTAARTPEEQQRSKIVSELTDKFREESPNFDKEAQKAIESGDITTRDLKSIEARGKEKIVADVKNMKLEDAIEVYRQANQEEADKLRTMIQNKYWRGLKSRTPKEVRSLERKMFEAGLLSQKWSEQTGTSATQ